MAGRSLEVTLVTQEGRSWEGIGRPLGVKGESWRTCEKVVCFDGRQACLVKLEEECLITILYIGHCFVFVRVTLYPLHQSSFLVFDV